VPGKEYDVAQRLTGSARRQLQAGEVDVWLTSLKNFDRTQEEACLQLLNESERTRWQRFLVAHAKEQYLVTRALVRTTLSRYADVPSAAWQFEANRYGRPHVAPVHALSNLHFNLSNTRELVVCAVSRDIEIGIDVETICRDVDIDSLAPDVFAPTELADFRRTADGDRLERFFSYWTLKESYIKARGMGLSIPLDSFWFELGGPMPVLRVTDRCPDVPERWRFYQFTPTDEHRMAIAVAAPQGIAPSIRLNWVAPV
jgi:4'-phosphopantetheinyl transferase